MGRVRQGKFCCTSGSCSTSLVTSLGTALCCIIAACFIGPSFLALNASAVVFFGFFVVVHCLFQCYSIVVFIILYCELKPGA